MNDRGIERAVEEVTEILKAGSKQISTTEEILQVATISANNDENIGSLIAKAMATVGKDGLITVQDGKTLEDELDLQKGMKLDRGYLSPYFVTDPATQKCEYNDPYVLAYDGKINNVANIIPILEKVMQAGRPLVIIAEDVEGEALATLVVNKLRIGCQVVAIKAPGFGERRKDMLSDIATLVGGQLITPDLDMRLQDVDLAMLGTCKKITITKDDTLIVDGGGTPEDVEGRCQYIRSRLTEADAEFEKEKLQERLAKLSGGVAVIKVGGASEAEVGEKKDRIEDALNATRAAVEEGIRYVCVEHAAFSPFLLYRLPSSISFCTICGHGYLSIRLFSRNCPRRWFCPPLRKYPAGRTTFHQFKHTYGHRHRQRGNHDSSKSYHREWFPEWLSNHLKTFGAGTGGPILH